MKKLNVCLFSYEFPPMIGGEGQYTFTLANSLSALGHNVTVITTDIGEKTRISDKYEFELIRIPIIKFGKIFYFNEKGKRKIKEINNNKGIDIIHCTNDVMFHSISKKDVNVPLISTIHHPWAAERRFYGSRTNLTGFLRYAYGKKIYYLEWLEKRICNNSDMLIAVSNYTANSITKEYRIFPDKIIVIPNSVDVKKFNPDVDGIEIRQRLDLLSSPLVLYVGNLNYHKDVNTLIKSFVKLVKDIPDAKLLIAGDGPIKKDIENSITANGLERSVIMAGRVSMADLPKFYAASDIVVLPSLMEGFGIVLLEAMATGKPCVTTSAGGAGEVVVNNETGFVVPPADSDSLYQAIRTLLQDEEMSKNFGKSGRKRVMENFTSENIAKRTLDLYYQILSKHSIHRR